MVMMMAIVRKSLAHLISKSNSFVSKSHVSSSLSLQLFSTWRERQLVTSPRVYDLLVHKHHFSPQVAQQAASGYNPFRTPETADSILSFLKESICSSTQLEKILKQDPRILWLSVEDVKFKVKIFQDLGFSSQDIAKLISSNWVILHLSTKKKIIPSISVLKGLLESDCNVARLLRKSGWFLQADLEKTLLPNVDFLKSSGILMERILSLLYNHPRCLLIKPNVLRKSVDRAKEMGFNQSSKMFIHAVRVIASMSKGNWEVKLQAFRDLGFSDRDISTMFRKAPLVFGTSMKKVEKIKELLLATGKFSISSIVDNPASLSCSIEKLFQPRLQILRILGSRNLLNMWPDLGTMYTMSDDKFFDTFVSPYSNELREAYIKEPCQGQREMIFH